MKNFLKNFIKKIAEQNDKTFGSGKLDCCDINKSNNTKKVDNKNK
ncbi:LDCC motif putative metal-binding protein [Clostridium cochlearium]|nr:LDCC motif putative metal-binding protein [Clostridium cochlearium]